MTALKNIFRKNFALKCHLRLALLSPMFFACAFAGEMENPYEEMASYKAGDSLAWYHQIEELSRDSQNADIIESKILEKIASEKGIGDEAFNMACSILKLVASDKCVKPFFNFLNCPERVVSACEVLRSVASPASERAMRLALEKSDNPECSVVLVSSLGAFGKDRESLEAVLKTLKSQNDKLVEASIYALGAFKGKLSKTAFEKLSQMDVPLSKKYVKAWKWAMLRQTQKMVDSGNIELARCELEKMPDTQLGKTALIAMSIKDSDKRAEFLVSRFLANGKDLPEAGRLFEKVTFENAKVLAEKFASFNKAQKLIAISLFASSKDPRFFETVATEFDSKDDDLVAEAVFAARFLASKKADFEKILSLARSNNTAISKIAEKVLEENPSEELDAVLRAQGGDLFALRILAYRGDKDAYERLRKMFFENLGDSRVSMAFESVLTLEKLPDFVKIYKGADDKTKTAITRSLIKSIAKLRDRSAMEAAAKFAIGDSILPEDKNFDIIENRLKIDIPQGKKVWQEKYLKRAVPDKKMIVATSPEPNLDDGFTSLFDGKTLKGWRTTTGSAKYEVVDGQIVGTLDPKMKKNSFLVTEKNDFSDFIFTCEFKWLEHSNSGIIFRGSVNADGFVIGPQAEIDEAPRAWSGGIYSERASWIYSISREDQEHVRKAIKLDDWNRLTIYCKGSEMKTWINGVPAAETNWGEFKSGFIGLQIHSGKQGKVAWKNIKIKAL